MTDTTHITQTKLNVEDIENKQGPVTFRLFRMAKCLGRMHSCHSQEVGCPFIKIGKGVLDSDMPSLIDVTHHHAVRCLQMTSCVTRYYHAETF